MHLIQRFLKILPLVLALALILLLSDWNNQQREAFFPSVSVDDLPEADLRIKGAHLTEMEGDRLCWQLDAATAQLFEKKNYAQLEPVKATYFLRNGREIQLEGQRGDLRLDTKDLVVSGRVKVVSDDGAQLVTETLRWSDSSQAVTTRDWVNLERDRVRVVGKGMEANVGLDRLVIKEQVTTYIN